VMFLDCEEDQTVALAARGYPSDGVAAAASIAYASAVIEEIGKEN
jgi:hypothetical protein